MTQQAKFVFVLQADTAQAQAAIRALQTDVGGVAPAAQTAAAGMKSNTAALKENAAAARQAAESADVLSLAQARAKKAAAGLAQSHSVNAMHSANIGAQFNDVVMMAAAGQNPLQLALQQGTQINQVMAQMGGGVGALRGLQAGLLAMINPMSIATIGLLALGTAGVQALASLIPSTRSLDDAVSSLETSVDAYVAALKRLRGTSIAADFGPAAAQVSNLTREMAALKRETALIDARDAATAASDELNRGWLKRAFIGDRPGADAVRGAAQEAVHAQGINAQIAAMEKLYRTINGPAFTRGQRTDEERAAVEGLMTALEKLYALRASEENEAGKFAAGQMARDLEKQAALQSRIAAFGKNSAQVRQLELQHAREAATEKLKALGFDEKSAEAARVFGAIEADHAARAAADREQRARSQTDKLASIQLEVRLLGASNAAREEAKALAEAEIDIRDRSLSLAEAEVVRAQALTKARAQASLEEGRALHDVALGLQDDAFAQKISSARDAVTKAAVESQREYARAVADGASADVAAARAARVRAHSIEQLIGSARTSAADMLDELAVRQRVAAQVATGAITAGEANAVLQRELQLRPLIAAAAAAEGDEKARLTEIISALSIAYEAVAAEDRRQAANDYLHSKSERLQQLRVESALLGQNATVRARVLALIEAEKKIRELGLSGREAAEVRRVTTEEARLTAEIEKRADAWGEVQQAGESAIDGIIDRLLGADIDGALESLAKEVTGLFSELAIKNPLKNAMMGTDLATLGDVGGLQGIVDRLLGRVAFDEAGVIGTGSRAVQSMTIAAATVTINAASIGGAANFAGVPGVGMPGSGGAAALTGASGVPAQIWNFLAGKGLAPHQAAAILGHASAESRFNPLAMGDHNAEGIPQAFGLWQWNDRKDRLFSHIGGRQNLGDVNKQLEFLWHEFMTSENPAFKRLMAAPDLKSATWAMQGFERPRGFNPEIIGSGMHFDKRLADAEAALATFGRTATTSTQDLGALGSGMGAFGQALSQIQLGGAGGGGNWIGQIISIGAKALGVPGFARGGATGGNDPARVAGVVHEAEYVFDAQSTARIGVANLEALRRGSLRGFRSGGYVGAANMAAGMSAGPAPVVINNYTGQPVTTSESTDSQGRRQTTIVVGEQMAAALAQPGNPAGKAMRQQYGARRSGVVR